MRKKLLTSLSFMIGGLFLLLPASALAARPDRVPIIFGDAKTAVCEGVGLTGGGGSDCGDTAGSPSVDKVVALVINILSVIVGVAAVIMIIIGGFKYITSQGESGNTAGAKNTILYAIIGLVVVVLAQVIVKFVLNKTAGSTATPPKCASGQVSTTANPCTP